MADIQIEKAYQKQDGINALNKHLLFGVEQPTKKVTKKGKSWNSQKSY